MNKWPVFICYRQSDGKMAAARIFDLLQNQTVPLPPESVSQEALPLLDVYFDQAAPGVEDWMAVHEPYLKRARAIIVICTPGSKLNEGKLDWVHREIDWWLNNREMAPILVDPLGEEMRYVPSSIAAKWPNAQRIGLIERDWEGLSENDLRSLDDRVRDQFLGAIVPSGDSFYRQELDQEKERTARLLRIRKTVSILSVALLAVLFVAGWVYYLKDKADRATIDAQIAHQLAQARVIEGQAARTRTESRLLNILQKFQKYDAYKHDLRQWEKEFEGRAAELSRRVRKELPTCESIGGGSIYEGQMISVELDDLAEHEALFIYMSAIPGSSPRRGDWAPTVLDVFFGNTGEITPRRDLKRGVVKGYMASVAPENQWGLLMGLGTPHVLTHHGRNYRLKRRGDIRMNDEGDMIMGFDLCREAETAFSQRKIE